MSHISFHKPTRNYTHVHENTSFDVNSGHHKAQQTRYQLTTAISSLLAS